MTAPGTPAPSFEALDARLADAGLRALGGFEADEGDELPPGTRTLVLVAPREPEFWAVATAAPEFADGAADPLDRWSQRVIGGIACDLGAKALFPFTGPPWRPFIGWALRTGRVHSSPVGLLVEGEAGLFVSLRGALALRERLALPAPAASPCETCSERPCLSACPVGALTGAGYDTAACKTYLDTSPGADCMEGGCRVRRACPVSAAHPRPPAQSAFHMRAFHGAR
jgi:hypothetical protein